MVLELRSHQSGWMRRWPYNRHRNTCAESSERGKPSRNPLQTAAYRINRRLSELSLDSRYLNIDRLQYIRYARCGQEKTSSMWMLSDSVLPNCSVKMSSPWPGGNPRALWGRSSC